MSGSIALVRTNNSFKRETIVRFYEAIRYGAKIKAACQYAGINTKTYYDWKRKASQGKEPYRTFIIGVEQAKGEFVVRNLQAIHAHTAIDWKAAAWLLERSFPEDYAMRQYIEEEPPLLKELKELVGAGLISVSDIRVEMPDLPGEYFSALMALEASMIDEQIDVPQQVVAGEAVVEAATLPEEIKNLD